MNDDPHPAHRRAVGSARTLDACHGVVFSDLDGVIYTGAPLQ